MNDVARKLLEGGQRMYVVAFGKGGADMMDNWSYEPVPMERRLGPWSFIDEDLHADIREDLGKSPEELTAEEREEYEIEPAAGFWVIPEDIKVVLDVVDNAMGAASAYGSAHHLGMMIACEKLAVRTVRFDEDVPPAL